MKISLKNLEKSYKEKQILDIEALDIQKGKITGIIGPNGAGKSTLINIVAGLDKEFKGTITYDDKLIDKSIYNKMTLVFQKSYLFRRSVYDNIAYPLKIRRYDNEDIGKKVSKVILDLDIEELTHKKGHLLSGGESQKVALARSMVFEPELILLDEPTSNIDPESIKIMEREIVKYNCDKKATVLIITHNLEQAKRICDDVIYLDRGKVVQNNGVF